MIGNLLHPLPDAGGGEVFEDLLKRMGVRVERIVSHGQITPVDAPYVQPHEEWVLLLAGAARLWIAERGDVELHPGMNCLIPAGVEHRVTWTAHGEATVWLALHFGEPDFGKEG